jgi:hypothetical protein
MTCHCPLTIQTHFSLSRSAQTIPEKYIEPAGIYKRFHAGAKVQTLV